MAKKHLQYKYNSTPGEVYPAESMKEWGERYMEELIIEENVILPKNRTEIEGKTNDLSYGKKPPISLVPPVLIVEVAKCMEDGAKKRSAYNWRESQVSAMQLLDKVLRHTLDCLDGKDLTDDTKLSNLASAAADIGVYLDAQKHGTLIDDRPKGKNS